MAKRPSTTRSIRLPDWLWIELAAEAERRDMSVNALVAAGAEMAARHSPKIETLVQTHRIAAMVEPARLKKPAVPYGSRLKKPKGSK